MFIIVPKRGHRQKQQAEETAPKMPTDEDDGPVRIATACDSCRVKKTKCNGARPCAPCKKRCIICVYSRPTNNRDTPVTQAQLSLMDHQQQRLSAAVQRMASVIAKYETGVDRPLESFNVIEQLEKYAPQHNIDDQSMPTNDHPPSRPTKRKRGKEGAASTSPQSAIGSQSAESESQDDFPLQLQPNPTYVTGSGQSQESYESMLQIIRSMTNSQATSMNPGTSVSACQPSSNTSGYQIPMASMGSQELQPYDFMSIVDWDASLQHLQNSQHLLFGDLDPNFEPLPESSNPSVPGAMYSFNTSPTNNNL